MSGTVGQVGARSGIVGPTDSTQLDYEEGSWTPAIIGSTSESGQVYITGETKGKYVKIGKIVHCMFRVKFSSEGTFNGTYLLLDGLPFTITSSPTVVSGGNLYFESLGVDVISVGLQFYQGDNKAYLWAVKEAATSRVYLASNDLGNSTTLSTQLTYISN